jgi:ADP-heptose:LPS heptosyltransferase
MTMITNAIGFQQGQLGDLVIATVAARAFKQQFPDARLTFGIAEKYRDALPLFFCNKHINDFHIWDGYDNWPTKLDREYMYFRGFDRVFNAMPPHSRPDWYNYRTYGEENCIRFGLKVPDDTSYELVQWFPLSEGHKKTITLSLFPSAGQLHKTMPVDECEKLCVYLKAAGYSPVQIGGKFEYVRLANAYAPHLSIFEATKLMLSSAFHITADTAFSSIAAAYKHPVLGFYGINYPDMVDCFSHLPPNPNAIYIKNRDPQTVKADELMTLAQEGGLLT